MLARSGIEDHGVIFRMPRSLHPVVGNGIHRENESSVSIGCRHPCLPCNSAGKLPFDWLDRYDPMILAAHPNRVPACTICSLPPLLPSPELAIFTAPAKT